MNVNPATLDFLISPAGEALLNELAHKDLSESYTLAILTRLRKHYDAGQAGAALAMARLRQKAVSKFGDEADKMLFTPDALEQASDPQIRQYRAGYTAGKKVLDVCCGIGSDALAMARAGAAVTGLDIDPVRIAIARHNAAVLNLPVQFAVSDVTAGIPDNADLIFFDPARRDAAGRRIFHVEQYRPPLSLIKQWQAPHIVAKLSPGVDLAQLADYGGRVEFISVNGDLKEAVLWINDDAPVRSRHARSSSPYTKATLITPAGIHHWQRTHEPQVAVTPPRAWLVEPDAAILRAGLVQDVAEALKGTLLDETIACFTTDTRPDSPWVRAWQILDWLPYNLKKLRARLREQGVGRVTVKKRGSPVSPEELISGLKLKDGSASRTLMLTRHAGNPIVLICADIGVAGQE